MGPDESLFRGAILVCVTFAFWFIMPITTPGLQLGGAALFYYEKLKAASEKLEEDRKNDTHKGSVELQGDGQAARREVVLGHSTVEELEAATSKAAAAKAGGRKPSVGRNVPHLDVPLVSALP